MSKNYHVPLEKFVTSLADDQRLEQPPQTLSVVYGSNPVGIAQLHNPGSGPAYVFELSGGLEEKRNSGSIDAVLLLSTIDPPLETGENVRISSVLLYDRSPLP
jgi:hypothetical protein